MLAGCASPSARIRANPQLFASFPADVQGKVRQGQVDLGFTRDMVRMALGEPNRTYQRQTTNGTTDVWSYTAYEYVSDRQLADTVVAVPDAQGRIRFVPDWVWVDTQRRNEYEHLRLEFTGDKVTAVERLRR